MTRTRDLYLFLGLVLSAGCEHTTSIELPKRPPVILTIQEGRRSGFVESLTLTNTSDSYLHGVEISLQTYGDTERREPKGRKAIVFVAPTLGPHQSVEVPIAELIEFKGKIDPQHDLLGVHARGYFLAEFCSQDEMRDLKASLERN